MGYPRVIVNRKKIKENIVKLVEKSKGSNIDIMGITKVFSGNKELAKMMVENGVKYLGDSRLENLKKFREYEVPKVLIRLPMGSQVEDVIRYSDISLNSEISVISLLNKEAKKQDKIHKIILMIELGDLREGILFSEVKSYVERIIKMKNIRIEGIGTNLTCYGGVIPTEKNLGELEKIANFVEKSFNMRLNIISGGNSSSLDMLFKNKLPKKINNLRLGEALIFGRETAFGENLKGYNSDTVLLQAEIIELKEKESFPEGKLGVNAFGEKMTFEDLGIRERAIIAIGKQDVSIENIILKDKEIKILGASSDHMVLDITDSKINYRVGSILEFKLNYSSLLELTTSPYVKVVFE